MPNDQTAQTDATQTPPEEIAYTPTVWQDGEDGGTPINAANMNNIEEAIVALVERTTKQVVTSMIADGAVTNAKLDQTLRDSLSLVNNGIVLERADGSIDDIIAPGTYLVSDAIGLPQNAYNYGVLLVFRIPVGSTAVQIYVTDTASARVYVRQRWNNGSWRNWTLLQAVS